MSKDFNYYQDKFIHLRRNMQNGGAPHKPVLLLSVCRLFRERKLSSPVIEPSPLLFHTFKNIWNCLVKSAAHTPSFCYPFFHLRSEPFWKLIPRNPLHIPHNITSIVQLTDAYVAASIDDELYSFLMQPLQNIQLEKALVEKYFDISYLEYCKIVIPPLEDSLQTPIQSDKIIYSSTVSVKAIAEENNIMRGQLFKQVIPQIYDHTCAISRLRLNSMDKNISMVDACHIIPFSESHDDSIGNGIALCPNLHRAFDRGLISISDDYTVIVNSNFAEDTNSVFSLSQFNGQKIKLPYKSSLYPDREHLAAHRAKWGFAI